MEPVKLNQNVGGAGALGLVLLVMIGGAFFFFTGTRAPNPTEMIGTMDAIQGGKLTLAKFNQLQTGMTYDQAVAVIGEQGQEQSRTEMMGISTVSVMWQNPTGANVICMFQQGRLNSKAQFGLN